MECINKIGLDSLCFMASEWLPAELPDYQPRYLDLGFERPKTSPRLRRQVIGNGVSCAYCGYQATVCEHVVPLVRGGGNDATNMVASCGHCNNKKGTQSAEYLRFYLWLERSPYGGILNGPQALALAKEGLLAERPLRLPFFSESGVLLVWSEGWR